MKLKDLMMEQPNQYKFKKVGIDKYTTSVSINGLNIKVTVTKNGNKWRADSGGHATASGDTKRFAVIHLVDQLRKMLRSK